MKRPCLFLVMLLVLAGCQTGRDVSGARYEKMQREVDIYLACGASEAYGMATTALRPRDIAAGAMGACGKSRQHVVDTIQKRYPSEIWSKLTIDIDKAFTDLAVFTVIERRRELKPGATAS